YRRFTDSFYKDSNNHPRYSLYLAAIVPYNSKVNFPYIILDKIKEFATRSEINATRIKE
ncbi:hypothetical protein ACRALDRAFT_1029557, partial [Sodiomyces alcalophilus JCM 7366]|uniref:uncharacterized protein n=1 Tax=Sodiomyces alcalophilus JCM 7366 TaxID=591952 RepID=UPI0039B3C3A4